MRLSNVVVDNGGLVDVKVPEMSPYGLCAILQIGCVHLMCLIL